ncbi:MAG: phosphoribosylglycinamide formyltransferase [Bacteroidales bacterium]|nr:phosphoribosylglycinamide formyltransferase [Bacteroidales bacterium]
MPHPTRIVVLISGGGTTLQNLIDRIAAGSLSAEIVAVISSRADAFGLTRASRAGIPVQVIPPGAEFSERVFAAIRSHAPDLVILAGWLKLLRIPPDFEQRVLNIHPSLLPAFGGQGMYGRRVHEAVLASGASSSGCTVHYADNSYDTGPILLQQSVPVLPGDTPETLAERVFAAECELYPAAIHRWAADQSPTASPAESPASRC